MQRLAEICIQRPIFATMLVGAVVATGAFSYMSLGVDLYPAVAFPAVTITTADPGTAPEEIEAEITDRIEAAVSTISGVDQISSTSAEGVSMVVVMFLLDVDASDAAESVRSKVGGISDLPVSAQRPIVDLVNVTAAPILQIAVSGQRPLNEVTQIADTRIKRAIEHLDGVGEVKILGGTERQVSVLVDPQRMKSFAVTVDELNSAIVAANVQAPGGRLVEGPREIGVRTMGQFENPSDILDVPVAIRDDYVVKVRDLARVDSGYGDQTTMARLNGAPAVNVTVSKQSGGNSVDVATQVKAVVEQVRSELPSDIDIVVVADQSIYIQAAVDAIKEHMLLGGLLAAAVVFAFLRSFHTTLIAAVAIPISLIATFSFMRIAGYTLNQVTMLALTLMIGIVIDDAIVVMENIFRFVEKGMKPMEAAVAATREIGFAVMATTLSLLAVFVPVAFMGGVVGRFMSSFGLTAAFAIAISLFVSFTLTPMMAARLIRPEDVAAENERSQPIYDRLESGYLALLNWSLNHRRTVVVLSLLTFLATIPIFSALAKNFMPEDDQSAFQVDFSTAQGSSLAATLAVGQRVAGDLRAIDGVDNTLTTIGSGQVAQSNNVSVIVRLAPVDQRSQSQNELMTVARGVVANIPTALNSSVEAFNVLATGGGRNAAVQFVVTGPEFDKLEEYSDELLKELSGLPNIIDPASTFAQPRPELRVVIDRARAADLGVSVTELARAVSTMIAGVQVGTMSIGANQVPIRVQSAPEFRTSAQDLGALPVLSARIGTTDLSSVSSIENGTEPATIERFNRQRQVTVEADLAPGGSQQAAVSALVTYAADSMNLDPGYSAAPYAGSAQLQDTARAFLAAISLSLIFMYMVLAAQFESLSQPLVILMTLPFVVPMGFVSLLVAGQSLNIFSALGLILLFGIVKKNAILQIDHTNELIRDKGMDRHAAIMQANKDRLRPILMTTLALVIGMTPLVIAGGVGSGINRSIGSLVVGGQSLCLLLTLIAVPVFMTIFEDLGSAHPWTGLAKRLRPILQFRRPRKSKTLS